MTVFNDYQCPRCAELDVALESAMQNGESLEVRVRHNPLTRIHPGAFAAAVAAECAADQGRFAAFHHALFQHQYLLTDSVLRGLGREVGVPNMAAFNACLSDDRAARRVRDDTTDAAELHLQATPAIMIGDSVYFGARDAVGIAMLLGRHKRG